MLKDIFGKALLDFHYGNPYEDIITHSSLDEKDVIPVPYLFREFENMPKLEQQALTNCKGKILDIGCGAGNHSLYLQEKGYDVTALDVSTGAVEVCHERGLKKTVCNDYMTYSNKRFDTLLMLMNGIGVVGNLNGLSAFLERAKKLLKPKGSILFDSSDLIYMFETEESAYDLPENKYYGEIEFTMTYKGEKGNLFNWLYLDFDTLLNTTKTHGYNCELLAKGDHYDYLAKLSLKL